MTSAPTTQEIPAAPDDDRIAGLAILGGVLTWVAVLLPVLLDPALRHQAGWAWLVLDVAYLVVFLADVPRPLPPRWQYGQALALCLLGLALMVFPVAHPVNEILAVTTSAVVATVLPLRGTCAVIALQLGVILAKHLTLRGETVGEALFWVLAYGGFQFFAVVMVELQKRADTARRDLDRAHAELALRHEQLTAAQADLARASREAERLRIARDLHDTMGHQLTALALNLEALAHHTAATPAASSPAECRDLARGLLAEVREVVGRMRTPAEQPVAADDLTERLRSLVESTPAVAVLHVEDLPALDPARADAVFHATQEGLTNAARHAGSSGGAPSVDVTVRGEDGEVVLRVVDDGPGSATPPTWGNGLHGMSERFGALGGVVTVHTAPGEGFRIVGRLPVEAS